MNCPSCGSDIDVVSYSVLGQAMCKGCGEIVDITNGSAELDEESFDDENQHDDRNEKDHW